MSRNKCLRNRDVRESENVGYPTVGTDRESIGSNEINSRIKFSEMSKYSRIVKFSKTCPDPELYSRTAREISENLPRSRIKFSGTSIYIFENPRIFENLFRPDIFGFSHTSLLRNCHGKLIQEHAERSAILRLRCVTLQLKCFLKHVLRHRE